MSKRLLYALCMAVGYSGAVAVIILAFYVAWWLGVTALVFFVVGLCAYFAYDCM